MGHPGGDLVADLGSGPASGAESVPMACLPMACQPTACLLTGCQRTVLRTATRLEAYELRAHWAEVSRLPERACSGSGPTAHGSDRMPGRDAEPTASLAPAVL